jgi:hypothetical protein
MPVTGASIATQFAGLLASAKDLGNATINYPISRQTNFDPGTGAGQVDRIWADTRTIALSSSEDIDLAGALVDDLGGAFVLARIRGILIAASPSNVNNVLIGGVANGLATFLTPAASGIITLRPGSFFALGCGVADAIGYAVTAATADLLHVANSGAGTSVTYDIAVMGTSV